jgi:hypothetical protein
VADTDLLTEQEARHALDLGAGDQKQTDRLCAFITAASLAIDEHFGPTVRRAVEEVHDGSRGGGCVGRKVIILEQRPVTSITSVIEYSGTTATTVSLQTNSVHPAEGFVTGRYGPDPTLYDGLLRRRKSGHPALWEPGDQNVVVNYVAGRVESTIAVDERWKRACGYVLEVMWRGTFPSVQAVDEFNVPARNFPAFIIPNATKQLLAPEAGTGRARPWGIA